MPYESHKYYNGNIYASIIMDVKNQQLFTRPICRYGNGCKKPTTIYETYMWVSQWM
jgi:hypothetical protein